MPKIKGSATRADTHITVGSLSPEAEHVLASLLAASAAQRIELRIVDDLMGALGDIMMPLGWSRPSRRRRTVKVGTRTEPLQ